MVRINFTNDDIKELRYERFNYPHQRVQLKMEALLLKSQGLEHKKICEILEICHDTLTGYLREYLDGGIEALKKINFYKPQSQLMDHRATLEEEFRINPPATVNEAIARIKEITGIERSDVQVGKFLKKIGLKRLKAAQIPAKADIQKQAEFLEKELEPRIEEAKQGKRQLIFIDASHFVLAAFLGYLWSFGRVFIKSPSGRQRYNVLGAFNAITHELITVTNDSYINAKSVIELMSKLVDKYGITPITMVLDNARYQRCNAVIEYANEIGIELLFLPSYSPNLNLIERLWKFVKKKSLYCKYYEKFPCFKTAINECLENCEGKYKNEICSLMTLKFQVLKNAS